MKKSYKGFPIYALIIIGVLIAAQLFSSSFSSQRGQRIEAAKLFEYIDSGVIDAVALEDDVAYAHMKASNIPLSAFSNSAYDFSAIISRDTFVETCRQLAARTVLPLARAERAAIDALTEEELQTYLALSRKLLEQLRRTTAGL